MVVRRSWGMSIWIRATVSGVVQLVGLPVLCTIYDTDLLQTNDEISLYSKYVAGTCLGYMEQYRVCNLQPASFIDKSKSQV